MGYIEDVRSLLKKPKITYPELLELLLNLEREQTTRLTKIALGVRNDIEENCNDMRTVWKIRKIANRLQEKINKKLSE